MDNIDIISRVIARHRDGAVLPGKAQQAAGGLVPHEHNYLPAVRNADGSYTVDLVSVLFKGDVVSEKEVSAYGAGGASGGGAGGTVTIVDNLTTASADAALSANQGRLLKEMIDKLSQQGGGGTAGKVTWDSIEGKPTSFTPSAHNHDSSYVSSIDINPANNKLRWWKNNASTDLEIHAQTADRLSNSRYFWINDPAGANFNEYSFNGSANCDMYLPVNMEGFTSIQSERFEGNASSATQLQTARALWGQNFDGTKDISGTLYNVGVLTIGDGGNEINNNGGGNLWLGYRSTMEVIVGAGNMINNKIGTFSKDGLSVNGDITASGEVTAYSDIRLKSNIKPLANRGVIAPITYTKDGKESIGFSAQEVRELYPELVHEDNTDNHYLSVNYAQYVAVLQAQIIELSNRLKEIENGTTENRDNN